MRNREPQFPPLRREVVVRPNTGLNARLAMELARQAEHFDAPAALITSAGRRADVRKLVELLMLGAAAQSRLVIESHGPHAEAMAAAIAGLLEGSGLG